MVAVEESKLGEVQPIEIDHNDDWWLWIESKDNNGLSTTAPDFENGEWKV